MPGKILIGMLVRPLLATRVALVCALAVLPGCFPYMMSYVFLDGPGVGYRRSPCHDGAPVAATWENAGVRFEVTLEPHALTRSKEAYLGIRVPRGAVLSLPDPVALISFHGDGQAKSLSVTLKAVPLEDQGPHVDEMRRKSPLDEYRYVFVGLPPIESPGALQLPLVSVNGIPVVSPVFTFERRPYAGLVPLNC